MRIGGSSATESRFRLPVTDSAIFVGQVPLFPCDEGTIFGGELADVISYWQGIGTYTEFKIHVWQSSGIHVALVAIERDEIVWGNLGTTGLEGLISAIQFNPDFDIEGMKDMYFHCPIVTRFGFVSAKGDSIVFAKIGRATESDYECMYPIRIGRPPRE